MRTMTKSTRYRTFYSPTQSRGSFKDFTHAMNKPIINQIQEQVALDRMKKLHYQGLHK